MQSDTEVKTCKRFGRLKYGNPSGDFTKALRCGAKTRRGTSCQAPAMANGRCRMHGGKSTGPKTLSGKQKISNAHYKHGLFSLKHLQELKELNKIMKKYKETIQNI